MAFSSGFIFLLWTDLCEELLECLVVLDILYLVGELLGGHEVLEGLDHQALQLGEPLRVNIPGKDRINWLTDISERDSVTRILLRTLYLGP